MLWRERLTEHWGVNPTIVFPVRKSIGSPPVIEGRSVIVNLTATLDGGFATVNPSTFIPTKDKPGYGVCGGGEGERTSRLGVNRDQPERYVGVSAGCEGW